MVYCTSGRCRVTGEFANLFSLTAWAWLVGPEEIQRHHMYQLIRLLLDFIGGPGQSCIECYTCMTSTSNTHFKKGKSGRKIVG